MVRPTYNLEVLFTERAKVLFLCLCLAFTSAVADLTPSFYADNSTLSAPLQEDTTFFAVEIYSKKGESLEPKPLSVYRYSFLLTTLPEPETHSYLNKDVWTEPLTLNHFYLLTSVGNHSPPCHV